MALLSVKGDGIKYIHGYQEIFSSFLFFIIEVMPDMKYHCQADQNDKNCKGGGTSTNSAPEESRAVASFPKIPAQILPRHEPYCF